MYNYFRQGWIVARLQNSVRAAFGDEALVLNLPSRDTLDRTTTSAATSRC